jgi:hypothetical protein
MYIIGVRKTQSLWTLALNWLINYFSNRQQYVECNEVTSSWSCGVPQGSVLGPLLESLSSTSDTNTDTNNIHAHALCSQEARGQVYSKSALYWKSGEL